MRRNNRKPNILDDDANLKIIKMASIGVGVLAIIVIGILLYSKNLNDRVREETLDSEQMAKILENNQESTNTQSASTEIGKSVNEAANELNQTSNNTNQVQKNSSNSSNATTNSANSMANANITSNAGNTENSSNTSSQNSTNETSNMDLSNKNAENVANNTNTETNNSAGTKAEAETETNAKTNNVSAELSFEKPVEGEIIREFAKDNLVYSQTLEEWTTHTGIDIKADKTTVVKSAEAGTIKSIKNDPRFGLTVVIEHANGFQTVYSNLLTSEFVVEGEVVEKGQSIGTVGNTAAFEIADEPHLHFEIIKDGNQVDPSIYIK